jgi:hypothetical protein
MMNTQSIVDRARRGARHSIRAVRSDNRVLSRYVFNARPLIRHRRRPPVLSPEAVAVVTGLKQSGVMLTTASALLGDTKLFDAIVAQTEELRARPAAVDAAKPFLTELLGTNPELAPDDPLLRLALHPQIRGIAETYAGMSLRVQDVNIWVNRPVGDEPIQSQRWHRDLPEDCDIVKCFVYLADVPDGAGPLQYVRGTNTPEGRKIELPTEFDGIGHRLNDEDVTATFGEDAIVTGRGPAGTLVFADTRGIHRGGLARDTERLVGQITYGSQASTRPRNLRPAPGVSRSDLRDLRLARA